MYQGSCLCGKVTIEVKQITDIIHCHCSLCRKSSGTAYATNGFVKTSDFVINSGQEEIREFELRPGKRRHFCGICASPVYSSNESAPDRIRLRLGILDSDIKETVISHNFVSSKANWDCFETSLPQYNSHEPGRR